MPITKILIVTAFVGVCLVSCKNDNKTNQEISTKENLPIAKTNDMKSYISMFEIPATDISRAINFYQSILSLKIEKMDVEGMQMGILPYEGQMVTAIIIQADGYKPTADGVTVYFNAGENLQVVLDKVEESGGKILLPKTAHADDSGYFALFLDSEGNKIGLNSPN